MKFFTQDLHEAYVTSETEIQRPILVSSPSGIYIPPSMLLVKRPPNRIIEAELHWFQMKHSHHSKATSSRNFLYMILVFSTQIQACYQMLSNHLRLVIFFVLKRKILSVQKSNHLFNTISWRLNDLVEKG